MRIIYIVPGFGGTWYCQNCMRDNYLITKLKARGHDVIVVPMYLPIKIDKPVTKRGVPVFYGAINVYLKEMIPAFRKSPQWLERLLNSPGLLKWAAKKSGSTNVIGLEKLTLSVLQGNQGNQARELDKLINWLKHEGRPDIVHLSNVLLIGLAGRIKNEIGAPVFCTLQDEDTWIDVMEKEYAKMAWKVISKKVADIDAFIPVSRYYASMMQKRIGIPAEKIHVVHIGINIPDCKLSSRPFDPPVIGFLSRMSNSLGLDILVDAFIKLKRDKKLKDIRLRATGGSLGEDKKNIALMLMRLKKYNFQDSVEFIPDYYKKNQCEFLQSLTVLSVPVPNGAAFGTYLIEALSVGVPVVQPKVGAFPEIIDETGGGIIYEPNNADKLAGALKMIIMDPGKVRKLGQHGRKAVIKRFTVEQMAKNMDRIYRKYRK